VDLDKLTLPGPIAVIALWPWGSTDMPGRNRCWGSWSGLKRIRTGSLWTTLTKLPLAFSCGRRLNNVPAAPV